MIGIFSVCTRLLGAMLASALAGCATTPVPLSKARQVPASRLLAFQEKLTGPSARLFVIRDKGLVGGGCFYAVVINGTVAARLDTGEIAQFELAPGEVTLRGNGDPWGKGLCGIGPTDYWTQRETTLRPGETKYFRLTIDSDGVTDMHRADTMGLPAQ